MTLFQFVLDFAAMLILTGALTFFALMGVFALLDWWYSR